MRDVHRGADDIRLGARIDGGKRRAAAGGAGVALNKQSARPLAAFPPPQRSSIKEKPTTGSSDPRRPTPSSLPSRRAQKYSL